MVWTCGESEGNRGKHHLAQLRGKRSRERPARQCLDDVKEWITRKASKTVFG